MSASASEVEKILGRVHAAVSSMLDTCEAGEQEIQKAARDTGPMWQWFFRECIERLFRRSNEISKQVFDESTQREVCALADQYVDKLSEPINSN